ncbi:MAG: helix-turn-helix domain-containing protein [Stellaceae bacterium]
MAADTLWRLAQEKGGETVTPDAFRDWRERKAYTLDEAAQALGLSRRMVAYYEKGDRPIPRVVALATRALEVAEGSQRSRRVSGRTRLWRTAAHCVIAAPLYKTAR